MKGKILIFILCIGLFIIFASENGGTGVVYTKPNFKSAKGVVKPKVNFFSLPLYFITNQGQVNAKARFYAKASRYTLWLTNEGLVFDSARRTGKKTRKSNQHQKKLRKPDKFERDVSRLMFLGANKDAKIAAIKPSTFKVNYFIGNDQSKWHTDVPTAAAVLYQDIYQNIDLKVYGIEKLIEYDWIIKPGGNPKDIRFEYRNVKNTRIDKQGNLLIETTFGEMVHKKPIAFQKKTVGTSNTMPGSDEKKMVQVKFKKFGKHTYGFETGKYEKNVELVIDPLIIPYSTYLGGSDQDRGIGIAADHSGNVYVTGFTSSTDFPTKNQYMLDPGDSARDAFVTKLDTTQSGTSSLIYSTYLGGSGDDRGFGIAVDSGGHAFVSGYTDSTDFPTYHQYQGDQGGWDAFVTLLSSGGNTLLYSTYLGGSGDEPQQGPAYYYNGISCDNSRNVYVTGKTLSTNFPYLNGYQKKLAGSYNAADVFVTKLDTTQSGTSSLIYSTYLGGSLTDEGYGISSDSSGIVYVTGMTQSTDFPTHRQYMLDPGDSHGDAFVTKLDTTQLGTSSLIYSTYLGGGDGELAFDISSDSSGKVYVTGFTSSTDFPTKNQYMLDPGDSASDAFVTKLDTTQSGTSSLIYSTYLGGSSLDWGQGISSDGNGNVYVTGMTPSIDFPTLYKFQEDPNPGVVNVFVTRLNTTLSGHSSLIYSTYLGGNGSDQDCDISLDSSGNVYVTGLTTSYCCFPLRNQYRGYQSEGNMEAFVTKFMFVLPDSLAADYGASDGLWRYDQSSSWIKLHSQDPGLMVAVDIEGDGQIELAVCLPGYGLYIYDVGSGWTFINVLIPEDMTAHGNTLACDFGSQGLWRYTQLPGYQNWHKLTAEDPSMMVEVDLDKDRNLELAVGFPGYGLYYYDVVSGWSGLISSTVPDNMTAYGTALACDYGTSGLWRYTWSGGMVKLTTADPGLMVEVDIDNIGTQELAVGFPGYGLYYWNETSGWSSQISSTVPDAMIGYGNSLACDYGTLGIWRYTLSGGMVKLNIRDPGLMEKADINNNGTYDLVVNFPGNGLYYYDDASGWSSRLNPVVPDAMVGIND